MSDPEVKTYKFDYREGFYTGIRTWIFFILVFAALGVPAVLCILLGAFAGLAARQLTAAWNAEEVKAADVKPAEVQDPVFKPVNQLLGRIRLPRGRRSSSSRRRGPRRL